MPGPIQVVYGALPGTVRPEGGAVRMSIATTQLHRDRSARVVHEQSSSFYNTKGDNMDDTFPPVAKELLEPTEPWHYCRKKRGCHRELAALNESCVSSHCGYTWGFTIYRTVYTPESNELFPAALEILNRIVRRHTHFQIDWMRPVWNPDPAPNDELLRRFHNEVIEDPITLNNVTVQAVAARFRAFAAEHSLTLGYENENTRYKVCLMVDEQAMKNLLRVPEYKERDDKRDPYFLCCPVISTWVRKEARLGVFWFYGAWELVPSLWFKLLDTQLSLVVTPDPVKPGVLRHAGLGDMTSNGVMPDPWLGETGEAWVPWLCE